MRSKYKSVLIGYLLNRVLELFFVGRYPGTHGIIANQFFDRSPGSEYSREFFDHMDSSSTKHERWWEGAEPIWATAQEQGVNISAFLWARWVVRNLFKQEIFLE